MADELAGKQRRREEPGTLHQLGACVPPWPRRLAIDAGVARLGVLGRRGRGWFRCSHTAGGGDQITGAEPGARYASGKSIRDSKRASSELRRERGEAGHQHRLEASAAIRATGGRTVDAERVVVAGEESEWDPVRNRSAQVTAVVGPREADSQHE